MKDLPQKLWLNFVAIRVTVVVLALTLALSFDCSKSFAQAKADLNLTVLPASDKARGGENFSFNVSVSNIGSIPATDARLQLTTREEVVSALPSNGACKLLKESGQIPTPFRCELGDLKPGQSVTVNFQLKIGDFGGEERTPSEIEAAKAMGEAIRRVVQANGDLSYTSSESLLGDLDVYAVEEEENDKNNHADVRAQLLPSLNLPPRVKITSPTENAVITRPSKRLTKVTFTIKAFDPDGTIEKIRVNTQQFAISVEHPENRIIIEGQSYSIKEVEQNEGRFQKYFGGFASKVDRDTYTFTLEDPKYGLNQVFVYATDNGNRSSSTSVRFIVKGDNSIEFTQPLEDAIIKPGTDVVIETRSRLYEGLVKDMELIGNAVCCGPHPMKQISKDGKAYVHQYHLKNIGKGYYNLQVILTEDSGAFSYSDSLQFKVTEKPKVRITSLKTGQVLAQGKDIDIELSAVDPDGEISHTTIFVNGTYAKNFGWRSGGIHKKGYISHLPKGTHVIYAKVTDDMDVEAASEPVTIIVK